MLSPKLRRLGAAAALCLTMGMVAGCGGSSDSSSKDDTKGSTSGGTASAVATAGPSVTTEAREAGQAQARAQQGPQR